MTDTVSKIREALTALSPTKLEIQDDSHLHAGHAGNTGGGHYTVTIESADFEGLSLLKRHQLVYKTVDTLMENEIHALSIKATPPRS
jgi:BolA protein